MIARKYNKRVEIWETTDVADDYGGNTVTDELITKSWANISTANKYSNKLDNIGITDPINTIIVKLRHRNDISYNAINKYLKYNGIKYIIQNNPTNVDLNNTEIEIIATREQVSSV